MDFEIEKEGARESEVAIWGKTEKKKRSSRCRRFFGEKRKEVWGFD